MSKSNKKNGIKSWISRLIFVVALAVFIYSAFQLYNIWSENNLVNKEQNEVLEMVKTVEENGVEYTVFDPNWEELHAINPDIMGFIVVPNTNIFYPLVYRSGDNSTYLDHTAFLQESIYGAIFLDGNSDGDLTNLNTIIYGHNVSGQSNMFSQLSLFFDAEFVSENPYIYIFTPTQNYRCEVVSAYRTTVDSDDIYKYYYNSTEQIYNYMLNALALSEIQRDISLDPDNKYITLSTCSFDYGLEGSNTHRYLVHAALVPWDGDYQVIVD